MAITIDGYLTQQKLEIVLSESHGIDLIGTEVKVPRTRCRWDFVCTINGPRAVVEFDGYQHYNTPSVIYSDRRKDRMAVELGCKVIRIPYWIQLDRITTIHFFGYPIDIKRNYNHGFVDKKALLPAAFCEEGLDRFVAELSTLPSDVVDDVIASLAKKMEKDTRGCVIPPSLDYLLDY